MVELTVILATPCFPDKERSVLNYQSVEHLLCGRCCSYEYLPAIFPTYSKNGARIQHRSLGSPRQQVGHFQLNVGTHHFSSNKLLIAKRLHLIQVTN